MSSSGANSYFNPDGLAAGQATMDRREIISTAVPATSQTLRLTYFTATKSFTANNIRTITGGTAAAATPTVCRVGLYQVNADKSLTLIGAIANDTTLWAAASTEYVSALIAPAQVTAGVRYAVGVLCVSAVATPSFYGGNIIFAAEAGRDVRVSATFSGQADLPATVLDGQQGNNAANIYVAVLP